MKRPADALLLHVRLNAIIRFLEYCSIKMCTPTPGSPSKFLMAAFVRLFAQKVTAEICPVQPFVMHWTAK
jgi:hypothetical protein